MSENEPKNPVESKPLEFPERIAHLKTGYDNSQAVVRFLDTKAAAAIGAVPIVAGLVVGVYKWFEGLLEWRTIVEHDCRCLLVLFFAALLCVVGFLVYFGWRTISAAFDAIMPRDVGSAPPSILFPFDTTAHPQHGTFEARLSHFAGTPLQVDATEDYRRQLWRMSQIVAIKIVKVNVAVHNLKRTFGVSIIAVALMVIATSAIGMSTVYQYKTLQANSASGGSSSTAVTASVTTGQASNPPVQTTPTAVIPNAQGPKSVTPPPQQKTNP